ncbi:MAG: hypothetical protein WBG54_02430 [Acidobacteriaceae bacterium]
MFLFCHVERLSHEVDRPSLSGGDTMEVPQVFRKSSNLSGRLNPVRATTRVFLFAAVISIMLLPGAVSQTAEPRPGHGVILGVLEDLPGNYAGQPNFRAVRVMFEWRNGHWSAFPNDARDPADLRSFTRFYPKQVTWTVAFHSENLGQVSSQAPAEFDFYSEVGIEKISGAGRVPTVGSRSEAFSGYGGAPVYRPLVAVSQPNYFDPQHWRRIKPTPKLLSSARLLFRKRFPRVSNCRNPDENRPEPWEYRDGDIQDGETYASDGGWRLVELHLPNWSCDGPTEDGGPFDSQWYVANPSGRLRFLGSGMQFVDAGDYDGTGTSDVLFQVAGDNRGGYRLYYQNFGGHADFTFNYH